MSFVAVGIGVGVGASLISGVVNFKAAQKEAKKARQDNKRAKQEYQQQLEAYKNLDTSNPYLNMENVMEDLTINQKEAEFSRQQFAQSQANIMSGLREAAGGSGIAALAQSLAQQGQLASQKSAASIGRQEATNQRSERAMAGQLQQLERKGEIYSRGLEQQRTETLLAMAQQRRAAALDRKAQAQQAKTAAITGTIEGIGQAGLAGAQMGAFGGGGGSRAASGLTDTSLSQGLQNTSLGDLGQSRTTLEFPKITPLEQALDRTNYGLDNLSFGEAFRIGRTAYGGGDYSQGAGGTFMYRGAPYTTNLVEEVAPGTFGPVINP
tara:strand:+ start:11936 stop:12904 length:969 start_codon:yes stop_codon:yes gene_type:complete